MTTDVGSGVASFGQDEGSKGKDGRRRKFHSGIESSSTEFVLFGRAKCNDAIAVRYAVRDFCKMSL